jgi:hypothetical protein
VQNIYQTKKRRSSLFFSTNGTVTGKHASIIDDDRMDVKIADSPAERLEQ